MTPTEVVRLFFEEVRSGKNPSRAHDLMAAKILAHQVKAEAPVTIERTPGNYAEHVGEMIADWGNFDLEIQEMLAQDDKVFVRWKQTGRHVGEVDGFTPTNKPVIEIASAVYRVENGKIAEYWIQIDRAGIRLQLEQNAL
jgi:predicted ester cyclase